MWLWVAAAFGGTVDVNHAAAAELESLPGIGAGKAQAIVEWREEHGSFVDLASLDAVPGIGPATLDRLRGLVAFAPGDPPAHGDDVHAVATETFVVDVNHASADELARVPGLGSTKARAIVDARDRDGPFRSCDELVRVDGIGPATVAAIRDRCAAR